MATERDEDHVIADEEGREAADKAALERLEQGGIGEATDDTPDPTARPAWCPEKYARYNADGTFNASLAAAEMSKGLEHANRMATRNAQARADDTDDSGDDTQNEGDDNTGDDADEGNDAPEPVVGEEFWTSLTDEYNEAGELSDESKAILKDLGIPETMVDDFIAGQEARAAQYETQVTSILGGGSEEYNALVDWADENMSAEEAEAFNAAVSSGDVNKARMAVRQLKLDYVKAEGSDASLELGGNQGGGGSKAQPFGSRAEMSEAINNPKYARDPAYRAKVEQRIAVTNL